MELPKVGDKLLIIHPGNVTSGKGAKGKVVIVVHEQKGHFKGFYAVCNEKINTQTSRDNTCGCKSTDEWYKDNHTAFFRLEDVVFEHVKCTAVFFFLKED